MPTLSKSKIIAFADVMIPVVEGEWRSWKARNETGITPPASVRRTFEGYWRSSEVKAISLFSESPQPAREARAGPT